eukprot:g66865.t1
MKILVAPTGIELATGPRWQRAHRCGGMIAGGQLAKRARLKSAELRDQRWKQWDAEEALERFEEERRERHEVFVQTVLQQWLCACGLKNPPSKVYCENCLRPQGYVSSDSDESSSDSDARTRKKHKKSASKKSKASKGKKKKKTKKTKKSKKKKSKTSTYDSDNPSKKGTQTQIEKTAKSI